MSAQSNECTKGFSIQTAALNHGERKCNDARKSLGMSSGMYSQVDWVDRATIFFIGVTVSLMSVIQTFTTDRVEIGLLDVN
jgi:hypothetical protein